MCSFESQKTFIAFVYEDDTNLPDDTEERLKDELYGCEATPCAFCSSRLIEMIPDMPLEEYCLHMVVSAYGGHMDHYNYICELGIELEQEPTKTIAQIAQEIHDAIRQEQEQHLSET